MKKILVTSIALGVILIFGITGCQKDTTLYIKNEVAVTTTVAFGKDIVPIFASNCAISGCHADGGHVPNLTPTKAYNSLINGKYIDTKTPANSIIYERLIGKLSPAMPFGKASNPSNINSLMLAWIKQGAKNN